MIYVFDCEVFVHDWLFVFKNIATGEYTVIHNDNFAVKEFMTADKLLVGFNNKHYDNYILKAVLCGADNALLKEINDFIIDGNMGFEHWFIKQNRAWFNSFDIMDDMQYGLSLKAIEGHLGLNIEESSVSFDIDRKLTPNELEETIKYCKYDVDVTERLVKIRKPYLEAKLALGRLAGIEDARALYATNAKLTAMFLQAKPKQWDDERNYKYPNNLKKDLIPKEVIEFFDRMHDPKINDKELFDSKVKFNIQNMPTVIGYGGVHGALENYIEEEQGSRIIRNFDVASLYPSLMIKCGYTSRNTPSPKVFEKVYNDRLKAKAEGNERVSETLKLVLNTTYGAMLNKYNDLYDPLMGRSVCISGQLFLTELVIAYVRACKTIKIINFNTDGVMFSIEEEEMPKIYTINEEWQNRTGFILKEDKIKKIVQKDVNNYVLIKSDGEVKTKGAYVTYGMSAVGAWNINNNYTIVKKAIIDYFVKGRPIEETINSCNDILEFQYIAKASSKYTHCYHIVDGKKVPVQKVNRVYATKDKRHGTLYKVHKETGRPAKIEDLPKHCIIDNRNELDIQDIDKEHYIKKAKKMINDFLGKEQLEVGMNEYVKLSELVKVPGIGKKTLERIRNTVKIYTFDEQTNEEKIDLTKRLDEILELN